MAHRNNMESLELDYVLKESWSNCDLVKHEIKIELSDEQVDVPRETSLQCPQNTICNKTNVIWSIKKEIVQPELVAFSNEGLPIVVKSEEGLNVDNNHSPDGEYKDLYLIDKCNEKDIKEEHLVESKILVQEELDLKDEDEGEDHLISESAPSQTEKWYHARNKTAPLSGVSRISTNNRRFHLTDPPIFKCLNCTYQTHLKQCMARHVFRHMENTLKCSHCSYRTWDKEVFRKHELNHVPKEQVKKLHQCPECSYTSVYKKNVTQHMIKHTKAEDAIWYQCLECPYKTKRKGNLTHRHMLLHKKDAPMHKCNLCSYETLQKSKVKRHMQHVHRPEDSQLIHCQEEGCSFKTHHRTYLKRHIKLMHECQTVFKCSKCSYETHYAHTFKAHELGHEDENKWFSCTLCPYKATSKRYLTLHMVVHKSDSDIKWFHCSECAFKSKHSGSLAHHKLIHNLNPQKILKCSECSYKTAHARTFRVHGLVHRKPKGIIK